MQFAQCARHKDLPDGFYRSLGFRVYGKRAIRLDMLERLADLIRKAIEANDKSNEFEITADMVSLMGCSHEEMADILKGLGYGAKPKPQEATSPPSSENAPDDSEVNISEAEQYEETQPPLVTLLWYPKKRATRRPNPKQKASHQKAAGKKPSGNKNKQHADKGRFKSSAHKKPEKKMDPNSPFAVLQSLKDNNK